MIRFIDLGNQIYPLSEERDSFMFAWWNTVTDSFEEYNFSQAWETWEDFEHDFHDDEAYVYIEGIHDIERYRGLFPKDWPRGVEVK